MEIPGKAFHYPQWGHHYSIHIRRGACCPAEMEYTPWSNHPPFTPCRAAYYTKWMANCNPQALFKEEYRWKLIAMTRKHNIYLWRRASLLNTLQHPYTICSSYVCTRISFFSDPFIMIPVLTFLIFFSVVFLFIVHLEIRNSVRSDLNKAAASYQIPGHSEYPNHNALPNILRSLQWRSNACWLTPVV